MTGGGGGYGDPREREPERVAADVRDGYVTPRRRATSTAWWSTRATGAVDERGDRATRAEAR